MAQLPLLPCAHRCDRTFVDLGMSPLCESYLDARRAEPAWSPSTRFTCTSATRCLLVQLEEYVAPDEIFTEYPYFSSYSDSWLAPRAGLRRRMIVERLGLHPDSLVVELASNDGYLLQYFVAPGIPVLGIEPAANVAEAADWQGHSDTCASSSAEAAARAGRRGARAPISCVGNNVLAQVPDLNDFVAGIEDAAGSRRRGDDRVPAPAATDRRRTSSTPSTTSTSPTSRSWPPSASSPPTASPLFDVEELPTHGGSLRIYALSRRRPGASRSTRAVRRRCAPEERDAGLRDRLEYYDVVRARRWRRPSGSCSTS